MNESDLSLICLQMMMLKMTVRDVLLIRAFCIHVKADLLLGEKRVR